MWDIVLKIFTPVNFLMMNIGMAAGIIIGAMPGLSVIFCITILLPFTFGMESIPGIYLLLSAYCGATYGGSITSILINTPGTPNAVATTLDGYPMAQNGQPGNALKLALVGSIFGGLMSCFALMFIAPILAKFALKFGPAEYFSLCVFGLSIVVSISGTSILKGFVMIGVGLLLSAVGLDPINGLPRFCFGRCELMGGIVVVVLLLGIFALGEIIFKSYINKKDSRDGEARITYQKSNIKLVEILKYWKTLFSSSLLGVFIGAVPGTGGAIAAMLSYNLAKEKSKTPDAFGKGCVEGILAPETANNAVTGATMIPMLTLGIPGDSIMAIMLGALTMQGITPGPSLFTKEKFWIYCIMGGLIIINLLMYIHGSYFLKLFVNIAKVPMEVLLPCILIFCTLGAYAIRNLYFDIIIMAAFGLLGFFLKIFDYPISPLVISLVLGRLFEVNLRRTLILSNGSIFVLFKRPISLIFLIISIFALCLPVLKNISKRKRLAYK